MEFFRHVRAVLSNGAPGRAGMRRRVVTRSLWGAVALLWALGGIRIFLFHISSDPLNDFHVYYDAAARLNEGLPLYPPGARIYPPLFSILLRPLALLPFEIAAGIWEGILIAALGLTLWRIGIRRPATWWAVLGLSIGIGWTLAIGQVEAIIALLLTIGSPFAVALAGNIKLYPLAVGIYWLARRDWHSLGRLAVWTAGLVLLQLVLDPANSWAFPGTLAPSQVASEVSSSGNLSPFVISPLVWLVCVAIEVAIAFRFGRTRWGWAAAVGVAVLAPPRVFSYNLMTLLACLGGPDRVRPDKEEGPASSPAPLGLGARRGAVGAGDATAPRVPADDARRGPPAPDDDARRRSPAPDSASAPDGPVNR